MNLMNNLTSLKCSNTINLFVGQVLTKLYGLKEILNRQIDKIDKYLEKESDDNKNQIIST